MKYSKVIEKYLATNFTNEFKNNQLLKLKLTSYLWALVECFTHLID